MTQKYKMYKYILLKNAKRYVMRLTRVDGATNLSR